MSTTYCVRQEPHVGGYSFGAYVYVPDAAPEALHQALSHMTTPHFLTDTSHHGYRGYRVNLFELELVRRFLQRQGMHEEPMRV
ncbi:MAG: hypothetical protein WAX89_03525 [Alphaproteobacteria bacterium]